MAKSPLTDKVYAGILDEGGKSFKRKVDVTGDFAKAVIDMYVGYETEFTFGGTKYRLMLEEVDKEEGIDE